MPNTNHGQNTKKNKMKDPWNPTAEEIRSWAKNNKLAPQDWDLVLCEPASIRLIVQLLEQKEVRKSKRTFFIKTLYVYAGDIFRLQKRNPKKRLQLQAEMRPFLESEDLDVKAWATQVQNVLDHSAMYRYKTWGVGVKTLYRLKPSNSERRSC